MSAITLDPTTSGLASITINGTIIYGTNNCLKRKNQELREAVDGTDIIYDTGPSVGYGELMIKHLTYDDGVALRDWIDEVIIYQKETFSIIPPSGLDVGGGKGTTLALCRLLGLDTKEMLEFVAPGEFIATLNYKFPKPA